MKVFEIILTMDDGHKQTITLHKSVVAHIYCPHTSFSYFKNTLSDDEIKTSLSIIKQGIVDYANANNKLKSCTIINRHTAQIEEYDFNTIIDNEQTDITSYIYDYIIDASIEYQFSKIKTAILEQDAANKKGYILFCTSTDNDLRIILEAIVAKLDIAYFTHTNCQLCVDKDDLADLRNVIGSYSTCTPFITALDMYINDHSYIPYHSEDSARKILEPMYI